LKRNSSATQAQLKRNSSATQAQLKRNSSATQARLGRRWRFDILGEYLGCGNLFERHPLTGSL
ncbi:MULTISPECIES: hypothetical protein, partial [Roseomonadaceae]